MKLRERMEVQSAVDMCTPWTSSMSTMSRRRRRSLVVVAVLAGGAGATLVLALALMSAHDSSVPATPAPHARSARHDPPARLLSAVAAPQVEASRSSPSMAAGVVRSVPDGGVANAEVVAEPQRAADALIETLVIRLRAEGRSAMARGVGAEGLANEQDYYLDGWIDSVLALSRDRLPSLSRSIDEAMCNAQSDGEAIVLSRLTARVPELATMRGLGCLLAARRDEDVVLANVLDAYRRAGLPPSPAWETWRDRATTPEIQRRFLPWGVDPPERTSGHGGTEIHAGRDGRGSAR